jgi:tRNA pseudouridine38-40 synthase
MRYFIRLSFNGTNFHGWQIQENAHSVQAELNKALETILRKDKIETTGCGRTDTGVHAKKFFVHFEEDEIENTDALIHQLNAVLPKSVAIHTVFPVEEKSHARFSATSRTYQYRVHGKKNPFLTEWSYFFPYKPEVVQMNLFASLLKNYEDFTSFSKSNTQTNNNKCVITFAEWRIEGEEIIFEITANRFLRNMVRAIVGTLLKAGIGRINENEFTDIIESKSRTQAGFSVPAHGLYLTDVVYPFTVY